MKIILLLLFCIALSSCGPPNRCNSPTHLPGISCMARIKRFTYNRRTKRCEEFWYGGCHPSPNNFITMKQCQNACMGRNDDNDHVYRKSYY
ncbi:hypothetical protein Y032_0095g2802 [Ancylostoma ceylanicum]|uniref:BPTI/Kunitz inhibitor domain-containing protein n=1 Tax=Ancylostoma ceylanicum TaxID=53326 RepID=A0A016TKD6_9BILA|nr:hypothetical protein Y032_0095g2802 [Ancylostoma ceylanicum]